MSWVDQTIGEFGRSIGIEGLNFGDSNIVSLQFESSGTLFLELIDGAMLVYMARQVPPPRDRMAETALALCHFREGMPFSVNAGLKDDDTLVFLARVPEADFSLPTLERAIALLSGLHDRVTA